MTNGLFTPRKSASSNDRYEMKLNAEDMAHVRRGRWKADITDQNTGKRYTVRGAACSAPRCLCDAVVVKELVCN
ncbi:hypothetical protein HJA82_29675 [Rhizobium bangladeshense]|uniref:hypothetical protein n=1 Tax=Rhizobium bangladeshense TaxID=1138189 RepID=UPI001C83D70E|nr:hypothetical protein [Rhizobium bangladeshense]MBX4911487.1 hypothetical protein [Rhizobium bangladeshense]